MISAVHQGALKCVKNFTDYHCLVNINSDMAIAKFLSFGVQPKLCDAIHWGDFRFASDEFTFIAKPRGTFLYYLIHPKEFVTQIQSTMWIAGSLTRIFRSNIISKIVFKIYYNFRSWF